MVVKPHLEVIYWFDPLNLAPRDAAVEIMKVAFHIYKANVGKRSKYVGPEWITVQV